MARSTVCRVLATALWDGKTVAMGIVLHHESPDGHLLGLLCDSVCTVHTNQLQLGYWYLFQMLEPGSHHPLGMGYRW